MAEEQSSLRSAIDRIMGWQPGGGAEGQQQGQQQGPVTLATPTPFSSADIGNTINTVSTISNEIPAAVAADPFVAELSAIKAQNAALASQIAAPAAAAAAPVAAAATAAAAPVAATLTAAKPNYSMTLQDYQNMKHKESEQQYYAAGGRGSFPSTAPNYGKSGQKMMVDPATGRSFDPTTGNAGPLYMQAKYVAAQTSGPPVNPGPSADWRASQAYWKNLEAYNKANPK